VLRSRYQAMAVSVAPQFLLLVNMPQYIFCLLSDNAKVTAHRTVILPAVLHWSVILTERHRLSVSQNRVPKRIFLPKEKEVAGGWRILHNMELHRQYLSIAQSTKQFLR
jgi:hypothetical protein